MINISSYYLRQVFEYTNCVPFITIVGISFTLNYDNKKMDKILIKIFNSKVVANFTSSEDSFPPAFNRALLTLLDDKIVFPVNNKNY